MGGCNCIAIIRACSGELVKKALELGASRAYCEGSRLIIVWGRDGEVPCELWCLVWQTMGRVIKN
ncbi:MAG: hypothetical protein ACP5NQ_03695 [Vulcanisaeta sp.]